MSGLQDLRVLVVENDEMSAALLQMQLVQAGAVVVGLAGTVAESLRLIDETQPQIALLDYRLARNETSDDVALALIERRIPFVVASGMLPEQLPDACRAGVVLTKPYVTAELNAALNRALQGNLAST